MTEQLTDLRTSNEALKKQLDITSQAHASLLDEITSSNGRRSISEDDDSGWWSDSGIGAEEDDTLTPTMSRSPPRGGMKRGSMAGDWLQRKSTAPAENIDVKMLLKENLKLRGEIERLEGILDDCSMVLGGMDG